MVVSLSVNVTNEQALILLDVVSKGQTKFKQNVLKSDLFQQNVFILLNLLFEAYKSKKDFEFEKSKSVNLKVRVGNSKFKARKNN